ncbi:PucR family transcriptional regulator [Dermacoccaceae bacterium W4C1]
MSNPDVGSAGSGGSESAGGLGSPASGATPEEETSRRLERSAGALSTEAVRRMDSHHAWYRELSAQDRSWVGMVAHAGIASFITWHRDRGAVDDKLVDVFGTAPRELTRSISLRRTLDLVRTVIEVVESEVEQLAAPGGALALREAVLHFSREVAFAAAQVYAQAAETRGAWDARLEALVVDAVLRGEADDDLTSRVSALGWDQVTAVAVVAGYAPPGSSAATVDALRASADGHGFQALAAVQGRRLVAILGEVGDPVDAAAKLIESFADGPVVVGPVVPHVFAAGRSARSALAGLSAARARPEGTWPCTGQELLAERALDGDLRARRWLVEQVARPLIDHPTLARTANAYLAAPSLEACARALFVHPNTVRYRLGRIAETTGYDLADPQDAFAVRLALALHLLNTAPGPRRARTAPSLEETHKKSR